MTALIEEIWLGVGGFNMDRGAELIMVDTDRSVPGEVGRIATVELFQENSEGVGHMGPE